MCTVIIYKYMYVDHWIINKWTKQGIDSSTKVSSVSLHWARKMFIESSWTRSIASIGLSSVCWYCSSPPISSVAPLCQLHTNASNVSVRTNAELDQCSLNDHMTIISISCATRQLFTVMGLLEMFVDAFSCIEFLWTEVVHWNPRSKWWVGGKNYGQNP